MFLLCLLFRCPVNMDLLLFLYSESMVKFTIYLLFSFNKIFFIIRLVICIKELCATRRQTRNAEYQPPTAFGSKQDERILQSRHIFNASIPEPCEVVKNKNAGPSFWFM